MAGALLAPGMVYRALGLLAFGAGFACLYFTFSRGGLLSAMVGLGLVPLLMAARGLISRKALVALVTAGLVMLAASVPVFYYYFTTRPGFYDLRLKHMRYGLQILAKNPIVGVGANNFNVSLSKYDYGGVFAAMTIHNHYLRLAIELNTSQPARLAPPASYRRRPREDKKATTAGSAWPCACAT